MSSENKSTFFGGAAVLAAGIAIVKLIGALYKIPLGNILGDEGFGHFNNAYVIYNLLLMVSTAGLPVALSKSIAEANALGRRNQVRRIFNVALAAFFVLGAVSFAVMFLLAQPLADIGRSSLYFLTLHGLELVALPWGTYAVELFSAIGLPDWGLLLLIWVIRSGAVLAGCAVISLVQRHLRRHLVRTR